MAKRVPVSTIVLVRKDEKTGKNTRFSPPIGQVFDFTADEIKSIDALEKANSKPLYRKPVNEDPEATTVVVQNAADTTPPPEKTGGNSDAGSAQPTGNATTTSTTAASTNKPGAAGAAAGKDANKDDQL